MPEHTMIDGLAWHGTTSPEVGATGAVLEQNMKWVGHLPCQRGL